MNYLLYEILIQFNYIFHLYTNIYQFQIINIFKTFHDIFLCTVLIKTREKNILLNHLQLLMEHCPQENPLGRSRFVNTYLNIHYVR
jgi:hypothetical protein